MAVHHNWPMACLIEAAILKGEGSLSEHGAFVVQTGKYTGRSPQDRFIVEDELTKSTIYWSKVNQPIESEKARVIQKRIQDYLNQKEIYIQDMYAGQSKAHRLPIRVVTEFAWHSAFVRNMFIAPFESELASFVPQWTVYHAPSLQCDPRKDGTHSEVAVILDFSLKTVSICGTYYAGEIKKSIFTVLNYLLPQKGVLGMHCSANCDDAGNTAIFFGLSGTGKTTLSADPSRHLIGDDEHGWDETGVFNLEGGCYAKVIRLSQKDEPQIFATTRQFGTLLENAVIDKNTRVLDLNSDAYTENTRGSYDLSHISNAKLDGIGQHPNHIVMLTCDAFGVFPPISKLTKEQAMYHFLNGYTARVAGTERGVKEPVAVFSPCFGGPFMPRHPKVYAKLLGDKMDQHQTQCWLVNTGWYQGPYGVGERMPIAWTRALLHAALLGELDYIKTKTHPILKLQMPIEPIRDVPFEILDPKNTWKNPNEYDKAVKKVAALFEENYRQYA